MVFNVRSAQIGLFAHGLKLKISASRDDDEGWYWFIQWQLCTSEQELIGLCEMSEEI